MTLLDQRAVEWVAERLVTLRRSWRGRLLPAVLVLVALGGLSVVQYRRAQARLGSREAQLEQATADLDAVRSDTRRVRHRTELTQYSIDWTRSEIDSSTAARTWIEAVTANTTLQVGSVDAERREIDAARLLVAATSNDAQACFDGVSQAVDANRDGDIQASVAALRAAAEVCNRTLAYATGARFPYDFPDPFVLRAGGVYYGYSTNSGAGDIQVIRSTDLVEWELIGNALAAHPPWAAPNATWAPAVLERNGRYVVYYTVREAASQRQCISRAVAPTPAGPFLDDSTRPLVCQREHGGSIDPSPFVDADGRAFLLWKSEGLGSAAPAIWSQELTTDGLGLTGTARTLISVDRSFEAGVVEAPTLLHEAGTYYLLYAAANWNSRDYSTAYATCAGPAGPCAKPADGRVLRSGPLLAGPGGVEVFRDADGMPWAAFHAFAEPNVGYPSSRFFHVARVWVIDGRIVIDAST